MTSKLDKMVKAKSLGIVYPYQTMKARDATGVPFYALCAVLEKESGGGKNIFGHDPTIFVGAGVVTEEKYKAYKKARDADAPARHHMQGVGPMQLTWYEFQDRADKYGGCWVPEWNILVGAEVIASHWQAGKNSWKYVGKRYNGADAYGIDLEKKVAKWKAALA